MAKGPVCVFIEHRQGEVSKTSFEILNKALEIAGKMGVATVALVCGDSLGKITDDLSKTGIDTVYAFENPELALYQPLVYARVLADWCKKEQPEVLWLSCSNVAVDLAARVAAKLETGLTAHVIDVHLEEIEGKETIIHSLPGWGGNFIVKIYCPEKRPQMATIRPGIAEPVGICSPKTAKVETVAVTIQAGELRLKALEEVQAEKETGGLEQAEIVIGGGWGLRGAGSLEQVYELAKVMNAEVGCTRPLVDCGWLPEDRMIGVSGKNVTPKLFISLGASGQPHYTTGFDKSGVIFNISNDAKSPLFSLCDVGIVGDLKHILPELIAQVGEEWASKACTC